MPIKVDVIGVGAVDFPDGWAPAQIEAKAAELTKQWKADQKTRNEALAAKSAQPTQFEKTHGNSPFTQGVLNLATPVAEFVGAGPTQAAHGVSRLIGMGKTETDPITANDVMGGTSDIIRGTGRTAAPVLLPYAAVTAPLATAATLATAIPAQYGAEKLMEHAGASPEAAALTGDVVGLGVGTGANALVAPAKAAIAPAVMRLASSPKLPPIVKHGVGLLGAKVGSIGGPIGTGIGYMIGKSAGDDLAAMLPTRGAPNVTNQGGRVVGSRPNPNNTATAQDIISEIRGSAPAAEPAVPGVELPPSEIDITPGGRQMGAPARVITKESPSLGRAVLYTSGNPGRGAAERPLPVKVGRAQGVPPPPPPTAPPVVEPPVAPVEPPPPPPVAEAPTAASPLAADLLAREQATSPEMLDPRISGIAPPAVETPPAGIASATPAARRTGAQANPVVEQALAIERENPNAVVEADAARRKFAEHRAEDVATPVEEAPSTPVEEPAPTVNPAEALVGKLKERGVEVPEIPPAEPVAESVPPVEAGAGALDAAKLDPRGQLDAVISRLRESAMRRARKSGTTFDEEAFLRTAANDRTVQQLVADMQAAESVTPTAPASEPYVGAADENAAGPGAQRTVDESATTHIATLEKGVAEAQRNLDRYPESEAFAQALVQAENRLDAAKVQSGTTATVEAAPPSEPTTPAPKPKRTRAKKPAATEPTSTPADTPAEAAAEVTNHLRRTVDLKGVQTAKGVQERVIAALTEELAAARSSGSGVGSLEYRPGRAYGGREGAVLADGEVVAFVDRYGGMKWADEGGSYTEVGGKTVTLESTRPKIGFNGRNSTPSEHGQDAVAQVAQALAKESGAPNITVQVPGDGEFTIPRTPYAIQHFITRLGKASGDIWSGIVKPSKRPTGKHIKLETNW